MTSITLNGVTLDAAEGPLGLKVYPPESLERTLLGYRERVLQVCYVRHLHKASHHRGRPKGGAVKECKEGIDQRGNSGRR